MANLRVAMVTPWGRHVRCGIRAYSEKLARALAAQGAEVYVVRWPRFGHMTPEIAARVAESVPADRVDLVHVQHEYGLFRGTERAFYRALREHGLPVVTTMHTTGVPGKWALDRLVLAESDAVVVHNRWCLELLGQPGKARVIPHGCEPREPMPRREARRRLGLPEDAPLVGYVGFISPVKGLEDLVEAVRAIRAALLVGGGWHVGPGTDYIARLKARALERLPGRVQFLGYVPDEQLPAVYGAVDVVAYPSRFMSESGALLMALSFGKAVVARDLPPVREKAEQGALWTFSDVRDLAAKLERLLADVPTRVVLERAARGYAERNSWPRVAEMHIRLYEDVLSG